MTHIEKEIEELIKKLIEKNKKLKDDNEELKDEIESHNEEIMSVEQAKTRCPDILREAMNNIVCKIEGENDD